MAATIFCAAALAALAAAAGGEAAVVEHTFVVSTIYIFLCFRCSEYYGCWLYMSHMIPRRYWFRVYVYLCGLAYTCLVC
jgi:hypothetical protein